jgi:alkylation response protein AidB-like acyl-CoA dehydrogenase
MMIGEGTNEIQRTLIARQLVERYGERPDALTSRESESDERRALVLAVRRFVDRAVVPAAAEHDAAARYPATLVRELAGMGVLGAAVDPAEGGLGLDLRTTAMLVEELARGWTTLAGAVATHLVATWALARLGLPGIRETWLPPLARGERLATATLGRPVTARAHGDGWTLDGTTALADNAPHVDFYLLAAADGAGQPLLALVERETEGLVVEPPEGTLGARGLHPCVLRVNGVRPERGWAGPEPAGHVLAAACVLAAATAVGVAQAAFEAALRYSQQRTTFGQPLWQHQAVQLKLADMATGITAARLLTYAAAGDTTAPPDPARAIMARLQAAPVAVGATLESMRIHGGYGYVREFPVERYYRDATRLLFVPQDDETLRADLAARLIAAGAGGDD